MSSRVANQGAVPISVAAGASTTVISAVPCRLLGVLFAPTAAVSPVITFNDNASAASGTKLATIQIESAVKSQYFSFTHEGIGALLGVVVSGTFTTLPFTVYIAA
jgi:hypothetical protein